MTKEQIAELMKYSLADIVELRDVELPKISARIIRREELKMRAGWAFTAIERPARDALEAVQKPALARFTEVARPIGEAQEALRQQLADLFEEAKPMREQFEADIKDAAEEYSRTTDGPKAAYFAECAAIDRGERDES